MRGIQPRFRGLAAFVVVAVVAVVACTGCSGYQDMPLAGGTASLGSTGDINPQNPTTLRDGGDLKLALTEYPPNFNLLNIDGNLADTASVEGPTLPHAFTVAPDGAMKVDSDYFTSAELTSTNPQVVTFTINPKAVWSDGTPITWADIKSQINATSGKDPRFAIAATGGADRVRSVTRGIDDRQAIMTFDKPYAEWRGIVSGLLPKRMTETPDVFNAGQLNAPGPSAGPFMVTTLDKTAQRIALTRNPRWWGTKPRLDSITFLVLDRAAVIPALLNGAIDAIDSTQLGSLDDLIMARRTKGISIRRAPAPNWIHFTFNGAAGSILADPALRLAIMKGIDRQAIANVTQRGLANNPVPLNNHIYVAGQVGYQDNSAPAAYNPEQARRELDGLGWKLNGQFREKNGRQLVIRLVLYDAQDRREVAQIAQNSLAQIGVKLQLELKPANGFFTDYVNTGDFDIAEFEWVGGAFPLASLTEIYTTDGGSNFGKIGSHELDAKIQETLSELDPAKARALANEVDQMIWAEGFSLPLYQDPGNEAARSDLANFGPTGVGDLDYTAIGFMK